jgi:cytochrome c
MQVHRSVIGLRRLLTVAGAIVLPVMGAPAVAAGDPDAGKAVFQSNCAICHSAAAGRNGVGPTLFGVVGRPSATASSYNYSPPFKALGVTWDETTLDKYLTAPRTMVPGTKMSFAGLKDDKQRADVIAYLATLK